MALNRRFSSGDAASLHPQRVSAGYAAKSNGSIAKCISKGSVWRHAITIGRPHVVGLLADVNGDNLHGGVHV